MKTMSAQSFAELQQIVKNILHELGIPVHRVGFRMLCMAVVCYCLDDSQSLSKELYPAIARNFGYTDWHPVEQAIRLVILQAWHSQAANAWEYYFPHCRKPPSNKLFFATIVEHL